MLETHGVNSRLGFPGSANRPRPRYQTPHVDAHPRQQGIYMIPNYPVFPSFFSQCFGIVKTVDSGPSAILGAQPGIEL